MLADTDHPQGGEKRLRRAIKLRKRRAWGADLVHASRKGNYRAAWAKNCRIELKPEKKV